MAAVGVASKLQDHQQQMTFLDQSKTLAESALQMLYAAKEGGGNPKVKMNQMLLKIKSTSLFLLHLDLSLTRHRPLTGFAYPRRHRRGCPAHEGGGG